MRRDVALFVLENFLHNKIEPIELEQQSEKLIKTNFPFYNWRVRSLQGFLFKRVNNKRLVLWVCSILFYVYIACGWNVITFFRYALYGEYFKSHEIRWIQGFYVVLYLQKFNLKELSIKFEIQEYLNEELFLLFSLLFLRF